MSKTPFNRNSVINIILKHVYNGILINGILINCILIDGILIK